MRLIVLLLAGCFLIACQVTPPEQTPSASDLLNRARVAHGYQGRSATDFVFNFRDREYAFRDDGARFTYSRTLLQGDTSIVDVMDNNGTRRLINGEPAEIPDTTLAKYGNALNSVIYFATLPDKLADPAVNLTYDGTDTVRGQPYHLLRVHFDEEGGGKDHDDNFLYWMNTETDRIDFLAYDYRVDGGGVRFREAFNPRVIDGILFLDHVNYKAPLGTPLNDLGQAFTRGELQELSRIILENVRPGRE